MRSTFAPLALAALAAANPVPQGVTSAISPESTAPAGCSPDYPGTFQIQVVNVTQSAKRSVQKRQDGTLLLTLAGGILKDQQGRTGYIADNRQFQFDGPPQTGAIYTAGWSVCQNGSLALGGDAVFKQCLSGDFYNLYDDNAAGQCSEIYIEAINGQQRTGATQAASQIPDGQVTASPVSQISDGQIQQPTGNPVTQIGDGQIQGPTGNPVTVLPDGQPQAPTGNPVTVISDGQPQAPTGKPVSVISDGQPQAPTGNPVTVISDGQPQAPTGAPVTQIGDGQIQAPTSTGSPVSQISDGQIQAPTGSPVTQIGDGQIQAPTGSPVTQIGDGQVQAPTGNSTVAAPSATIQPYTGAAALPTLRAELFGLAAGVLALAVL